MALKQDEDFLRYLTMGAAGSAAAAADLSALHGHRIAELERYTLSNKLWQTKIKRLRLPDLFCVSCGLRVEARAKTTLEITLSDSTTPGREWRAGLRAQDLIAFVTWHAQDDGEAVVGRPSYFAVGALDEALPFSKLSDRKAFSEGSEVRRTWPARVPKKDGEVVAVEDRVVRVLLDGARRQPYRFPEDSAAYPYVEVGDAVEGGQRFVLGVVRPPGVIRCSGVVWTLGDDLAAEDPTDRYSAVKAAGIRGEVGLRGVLQTIAHGDADPRIRLEALASLARIAPTEATAEVAAVADDPETPIDLTMETIFILTELGSVEAVEHLTRLAHDATKASEVRSAAVWGLGAPDVRRTDLLPPFLDDPDDDVVLHATAALACPESATLDGLIERLTGGERGASAAAAVLVRGDRETARALLALARGEDPGRARALRVLSAMTPDMVRAATDENLPPEVTAFLETSWGGRSGDWLDEEETRRQLGLLRRQVAPLAPPGEAASADT